MPRDIPVANGDLLVTFDKNYVMRDFYFPHIGKENQTNGEPFRFGVWVNGRFSWIPDNWEIKMNYINSSLVTEVEMLNTSLNLKIVINDWVDFYENIYVKKMVVENLSEQARDIRIFLCHDFHIYGNELGDTAAFRPEVDGILHYKNERYFLINVYVNQQYGVQYYATGYKEQGGYEGTWRDAEDGVLSGNPISQGSVDSVIGIHLNMKPKAQETCYYWISCGKNWEEVRILNNVITEKTPQILLKRTLDYWKLWSSKEELNHDLLPEKVAWLYTRSLLILRTNIDNSGAIIAGNDSDVSLFNRDTYSYMWPRDSALTAYGTDLAGYESISRTFFELCARIIEKEGYFFHKYNPSGTMASSWLPWIKDNKPQLPIQEDETALVLWSLWHHFKRFKDIEFIKGLYKPLIKNAADFMLRFRDEVTGLPLPSYDLWEERQGVNTFTTATVYGGLIAAANFTEIFGETEIAKVYRDAAFKIREAMDKYLYLENEQRFARSINFKKDGTLEVDATVDASLYGVFAFGAYDANDEKVKNTMQQIYDRLWLKTDVGGIARYENDFYHRARIDVVGNPWFVTTLWMAQYYIAVATNPVELEKALDLMKWVASKALPSGVLAEQVNPYTGDPISISPLTWSHGTYIIVVREYINKLLSFEKKNVLN